jgi:type VI secretion system secreted protein Hcp
MTHLPTLPRTRVLVIAVAAVILAVVFWQLAGPRTGATNAHAAVGGTQITMTVTGTKTGAFKGDDNASKAAAGLITVLSYQYELSAPYDPTSGRATGRRQHQPVTVTHELGGSSPQFLNSEATGETLTKVVLKFSRTDREGKLAVYYTVTLTNATIVDVRHTTSGDLEIEQISFVFQKIDQTSSAGTTYSDNWSAAAA